ncbi:MAG: SDR family NAD(P)-dependent oxidoreductase [Chlamydiales bacterium]|nr:SDR family NAD(P)-dependent oxidoreductase [Chlamydiales bacterium]
MWKGRFLRFKKRFPTCLREVRIFISSVAGKLGAFNHSVYSASKGAIDNFVDA